MEPLSLLYRITIFTFVVQAQSNGAPVQYTDEFFKLGQDSLKASLETKTNENVAKNVILFIGDGMGVSTVTAARIYKGQKEGRPGEETVLNFETFNNVALSKTYNIDRQVPDSAGTATAMMSGVKTRFGLIGLNKNVTQKDCSSALGNEVETVLDWAQQKGKWTGIVTTTRLTHATPAAAYGHSPWRFWEVDHAIKEECQGVIDDLAKQLLVYNRDIRVMFGGGRALFMAKDGDKDPEYPDISGQRLDGRNLIKEWQIYHQEAGHRYSYVWNATSFASVDPENTDFLLGIFEPNHLNYELNRHADKAGEPSIAQMTEKAIALLDNNEKGYFLLVEGGRIDHGHHQGIAKRALEDTLAFEEAIQIALDMTDESDTLIIVTADHSHTLTLGTYPARGNNILGFVDDEGLVFAEVQDNYPVTSLMYANGPGPKKREALAGDVDPTANDFLQPSQVPMKYETHAGEDVAIYAQGPMSHLISGVQEQNYIGHVMAYAACLGPNTDHCKTPVDLSSASSTSQPRLQQVALLAIVVCLQGYLSRSLCQQINEAPLQ